MDHVYYSAPDIKITRPRDENPSQHRFYMHTHTFAELYCFLEGNAIFHVEGTAYALQPGDIVLLRPAEAHYVQVDTNTPYERICLHFDTDVLTPLDPDNHLLRPFLDRKAGKQNLFRPDDSTCLNYLLNMLTPSPHLRLTILANLILLLQQLDILFQSEQPGINIPDTMEYQLIRYINKNLEKNLTIADLCDKFFVSRTQLCERFKEATGTTIGNYISVKRLMLARHMLLQGWRASDVFPACGYENYSSFYRAYKKYFGYSPRNEQRYDFNFIQESRIVTGQNIQPAKRTEV